MENANLATWTCLTLFDLSEVKVINGVKVIPRSNFTFYRQAGGGPSTERHSCNCLCFIPFIVQINVTCGHLLYYSKSRA